MNLSCFQSNQQFELCKNNKTRLQLEFLHIRKLKFKDEFNGKTAKTKFGQDKINIEQDEAKQIILSLRESILKLHCQATLTLCLTYYLKSNISRFFENYEEMKSPCLYCFSHLQTDKIELSVKTPNFSNILFMRKFFIDFTTQINKILYWQGEVDSFMAALDQARLILQISAFPNSSVNDILITWFSKLYNSAQSEAIILPNLNYQSSVIRIEFSGKRKCLKICLLLRVKRNKNKQGDDC